MPPARGPSWVSLAISLGSVILLATSCSIRPLIDGAIDLTIGSDPPEVDWGPCDDDLDPALECATLTVPLDHDDPDGDTIDLALVRLAAADERAGAILFNPGGPGDSGVEFVTLAGAYAAEEMGLQSFDLIGFDPRGVDRSAGIRCLPDERLDELVYDDDDAGDRDDEFTTACRERYGDTLRHYSTVQTARDMDAIRAALGDDQISYLGISYGTYLGAVYATLFPDRVADFVLDSAFEPTGDTVEEQYLTQLVGFEEAFDAWAADCEADPECPFTADDVGAAWDALYEDIGDDPVPADDGRLANRSVMGTATTAALYDKLAWPLLASALADARDGDGTGLFELADEYVGRNPDGTYSTITQSNTVISCASGFTTETPDDPEAFVALLEAAAPRFGADIDPDSLGDDCNELVPPVELPVISSSGDGRFMVIGGLNDPATPIRWSEEMVDALAPNSVLVTWAGEGHGQLLGSACLMELAGHLFTTGQLPDEGTVCEPDPPVEEPDWWDGLPVPTGVGDPLPRAALVTLGVPPTMAYGEARPAASTPSAVLDAYESALTADGFRLFDRTTESPGLDVATFLTPDMNALNVLVLSDEARDDPDFAPAMRLVPEGELLVVLLYLPLE